MRKLNNIQRTRSWRHWRRLAPRRGFTMVETVAAMVIFGLLMIVIGRTTIQKIDDQESIDRQYGLLAADAYMADIYADFHKCLTFEASNSPGGLSILTFNNRDGSIDIFSFDGGEGVCYKNGVRQFHAQSFEVDGAGNNLIVYVKLSAERILELNVFR